MIIAGFVIFSLTLLSCKKTQQSNEKSPLERAIDQAQGAMRELEDDPDSVVTNYIAVSVHQYPYQTDPNERNSVDIFANFVDSASGARVAAGDITIDGARTVSQGTNGDYSFKYDASNMSEGMGLLGRNINISIGGSGSIAGRTSTLYVPVEITPYLMYTPQPEIYNNQNRRVTWQPDPNNMFGKVLIQVIYYPSLSQYSNRSNPARVEGLKYTVDDNGRFDIPAFDLSRFPVSSYVNISISRATSYTVVATRTNDPASRTRVEYISVITGHTSPLLVSQFGIK